jgi:ribosome-binding protein aMBF1 (putative translation factor)
MPKTAFLKEPPDDERQSEVTEQIGERLRWAREALEITRAQLAEAAGVDLSAIRKLRMATEFPRFSSL